MINDFVMYLVSIFIIEPFDARISDALQGAQAPTAVMEQVRGCIADAPVALAEKVSGDWGWAIGAAVTVAVGTDSVEAVVAEAVPQCGLALAAVKPYLTGAAREA